MATPRMNDPAWVAGLSRVKANLKYPFAAIHLLAPLRDAEGIAPIVLQTVSGYMLPPKAMEPIFELCLRHLHGRVTPLPDGVEVLTVQALLTNRALEALKLPGRYVPTADGDVVDTAHCAGDEQHSHDGQCAGDEQHLHDGQCAGDEQHSQDGQCAGEEQHSQETPRAGDE